MSVPGLFAVRKKNYILVTLEENDANNARYESMINRVREATVYFTEAEKAMQNQEMEHRKQEEMRLYLECDRLAQPYQPEKIREFFYNTFLHEMHDVENTSNWLLNVDERSLLCQDVDATNRTMKHLCNLKPELGTQYNQNIIDAMEILKRIRIFVQKPDRPVSSRIMKDIQHMKFFTFHQINRYIDKLTYRILSAEMANMNEIDITSMQYSFSGKHFAIHIWSLKNVPLYLNPTVLPCLTVDMRQIGLNVVLPFSVIHPNMVVRGLHCHYDHFSDHIRLSEVPRDKRTETDLADCLSNELKTQITMQQDTLKFLIKQHKEYEEEMILRAQEEEQKARQRKTDPEDDGKKKDKEVKFKKTLKEPQVVLPGFIPDVRADFLELYELNRIAYLAQCDPLYFNLAPGEVNLRKYQILGGIFHIHFLEKPRSVNFPNLIISWYKSDKALKFNNFTPKADANNSKVSKFFQVTFTLPEYFCNWGEPMACIFEEGASFKQKQEAELPSDSGASTKLKVVSPIIINNFNINETFNKTRMYAFIEATIPRLISSFELPHDLHTEDDKKQKTIGHQKLTREEIKNEKRAELERKLYSFNDQHRPERLFPLFKNILPVVIMPVADQCTPSPKDRVNPYENFSEFYNALENIKANYRTSKFRDILGNPIRIKLEDYDNFIPMMTRTKDDHAKDNLEGKLSISSESMINTNMKQSFGQLNKHISHLSHDSEKTPRKKRGTKWKSMSEVVQKTTVLPEKEEAPAIVTTKWTTSNIIESEFKPLEKKLVIWTDRLGVFGLAFYRYQHFPFRYWAMNPHNEDKNEVELVLESMYAVFRFRINENGYRVAVSDFTKYEKKRQLYFQITEPTKNLQDIKQKMQQLFLNIFPERDYSFYTTGYFCEKHKATEFHAYKCMSLYATTLKYRASIWNKLASTRELVFFFGELRDLDEELLQICITPEDVAFVDIEETCSDLDKIRLKFTKTWRNLEWYPELNYLIKSTYNAAEDMRIKNPNILYYVSNLLQAIRPLSCS